ncbi:MAG: DUF3313 family protein [Halioglobus sp.]|nr:DUF3313 family protein [Halioglobus sp.]
MLKLSSMLLLSTFAALGACAQLQDGGSVAPERGNPNYLKGVDSRVDELYITQIEPAGADDFRNVYIAPADLSKLQIIQPEGEKPDAGWTVTEDEEDVLQRAIHKEFTDALRFQSAYHIVDDMADAEIVVNTTVVAIHPNTTRAAVEAGAKPGGAITVSIALVDGRSGDVMVRAVDTKSTDNIWAFNQVENDDPAIDLIFRAWGNSIRRGMLQLQGRTYDPLAPVIKLQQQ